MRRRLGVQLYETAQALFVYAKYASLYKLFVARYPGNPISFSLFKSLRPWYVRRAKQETCLCKHCENFKAYMEVLNSLVKACSQPCTLHTAHRTLWQSCTRTLADARPHSLQTLPAR